MNEKLPENAADARDRETMASAGIDAGEKSRSASFMQQDNEVRFYRSMFPGVELMPVQEYLARDSGAGEYFGAAFRLLGREYDPETRGGYFLRVRKGTKVEFPVQACLFLKAERFRQKVHNIIIVEEGASLYLIAGCSSSASAVEGFHQGTSEFFIKKGGYLNSTMVHSWREDVSVRPVAIAVVEEDARFVSNYISLRPAGDIVMYPTAVLNGRGARCSMNSLVVSHPGTVQDIGSRVLMREEGTQAEIISRTVSLGGKNTARAHILAEAGNVRGHLECRGLLISEEGTIAAVPELETRRRDVELSHEAAIGRISGDELEYLCSRGMTRDEAQSVIVRGFMDVNILALPPALRKEMAALEEQLFAASL